MNSCHGSASPNTVICHVAKNQWCIHCKLAAIIGKSLYMQYMQHRIWDGVVAQLSKLNRIVGEGHVDL
jgi:hypothetical protein